MQSSLNKLVILLSSSIARRKLYFAAHPNIHGCGEEILSLLRETLAESGEDALFIGAVQGKLVYDGRYLVGPSIAGRKLVDFIGNMQSGGISFGRETTNEEVQSLLGVAAGQREPVEKLDDARRLLRARGILNIQLASHYADLAELVDEEEQVSWQGKESGDRSLQSSVLLYQALFEFVTTAHGSAAFDRMLDINAARSVSEHLLQNTRERFTDMMQLVHYPDCDSYTIGHSVLVATLAVYLGDRQGLDDDLLLEMGTAALLHDVGKSKIPDEILFKPGRLDEEEFKVMKTHARRGAEILMEHPDVTPLDVGAAWGHHIRFDGGGYPAKPLWAVRRTVTALLQICDVFEALTAIRPYKQPMSPEKAYRIMLADEGAFDPAVLAAFVKAMGLYPPGNYVRLSDGCQATVIEAGQDIATPRVRIMNDPFGRDLSKDDQRIIDLADPSEGLEIDELVMDPDEEEEPAVCSDLGCRLA